MQGVTSFCAGGVQAQNIINVYVSGPSQEVGSVKENETALNIEQFTKRIHII